MNPGLLTPGHPRTTKWAVVMVSLGQELKLGRWHRQTRPFTKLLTHDSHQGAGEPRFPGGLWQVSVGWGRRAGRVGGQVQGWGLSAVWGPEPDRGKVEAHSAHSPWEAWHTGPKPAAQPPPPSHH